MRSLASDSFGLIKWVFLGHIVSVDNIYVDVQKVEVVFN